MDIEKDCVKMRGLQNKVEPIILGHKPLPKNLYKGVYSMYGSMRQSNTVLIFSTDKI